MHPKIRARKLTHSPRIVSHTHYVFSLCVSPTKGRTCGSATAVHNVKFSKNQQVLHPKAEHPKRPQREAPTIQGQTLSASQ